MATTYYAPADDIGALSRYRLQDEAQRTAAADSRRRYFAQLNQAAADRYRSTSQRDVGMRNADVTRELGLGQITSRDRIADLPYSKMTPAEIRGFEIQQAEIDLLKNNPNLLMDPRLAVQSSREAADKAALEREAEMAANQANQNLQSRGGIEGITAAVKKKLDRYSGGMFNWFEGLLGKDAARVAPQITGRQQVDPRFAGRNAVEAASKYFSDEIAATLAPLEERAGLVRFDPAAKRFFSIYATAPQGQTNAPTNGLPPVLAQPLTSNAAPASNSLRDLWNRWNSPMTPSWTDTSNRQSAPTNVPVAPRRLMERFRYTTNNVVPISGQNY